MGWRACDRWLGSVSNPSNGDRMMQASLHGTPTAEHCATISVAIELSMMSWVAVIHSPDRDRLSRHKLAAGDVEGLLAQIAKVRARVSTALSCEPAVGSCYEPGYDRFWRHRRRAAAGSGDPVVEPP